MSRRKNTSKKSKKGKKAAPQPRHESPAPEPRPPRPRMWFLATAVCLELAWLAFLLVMAITE